MSAGKPLGPGTLTTGEFRITIPPAPVGAYTIGGNLRVELTRRPHWFARLLCRWLLDWRWSDAE